MNSEHSNGEVKLKELLDKLEKKAFKQAEALLCFLHLEKSVKGAEKWVSKSEIVKKSDSAAVSALVKKGVFEEQQFEVGRLQFTNSETHKKNLTKEQKVAYTEIKTAFEKHSVNLLHGVTGAVKQNFTPNSLKKL
ncbi:MAG: hypothetical protein IPJ32_14320 [Sphingobacteriaceae bacterium]|nr:hypothetical protein [Sphingobacteriaceae bacterium]